MTANFIAQVVENYYEKLSLEAMSEPWKDIKRVNEYGNATHEWINRELKDPIYIRWCYAISTLETYLKLHFDTFEETELVYKWAKPLCEARNRALNRFRIDGWYLGSFSNFLAIKRF